MQPEARFEHDTQPDGKPPEWNDMDVFERQNWMQEQGCFGSVTIYRIRDDETPELCQTRKAPIDLDGLRQSYGTGRFQIALQKTGQRGCFSRSPVFYVGPGPRVEGHSLAPSPNQPNYAVPAHAPAVDVSRLVREAVAEALRPAPVAPVAPVAPANGVVSREDVEKLLREERERAERKAEDAAHKARLESEIASLRAQVADAKNSPRAQMENDPSLVRELIGTIKDLKAEQSKAATPGYLNDPLETLGRFQETLKKLSPSNAGSTAAEIVKGVSGLLGPALGTVGEAILKNQSAAIDLQGRVELLRLQMEADEKAFKRQYMMLKLQNYGTAEFPAAAEPQPSAAPALPAQPTPQPIPSAIVTESTAMALPLRTFVETLIDVSSADNNREPADRIGSEACIDLAFAQLARTHGEAGLDAVDQAFAPLIRVDLTKPTNQAKAIDLIVGALSVMKRPAVRMALNSDSTKQAILAFVVAIQSFLRGVSDADEIHVARMERILESAGVV